MNRDVFGIYTVGDFGRYRYLFGSFGVIFHQQFADFAFCVLIKLWTTQNRRQFEDGGFSAILRGQARIKLAPSARSGTPGRAILTRRLNLSFNLVIGNGGQPQGIQFGQGSPKSFACGVTRLAEYGAVHVSARS